MSKFLKLFAPSLGGAAVVLGGAYILADQFVTDFPAPLRDRVVSPALAQAVKDAAAARDETVEMVAVDEAPETSSEPAVEMAADPTPEDPAAHIAGTGPSVATEDPATDTAGTAMPEEPAEAMAGAMTPSADMPATASQGDPMPDPVAFDLGRMATPEEVSAWNIDVRPDGQGLPVGSGDVLTGETLYVERCSACHGVFGEAEGRWPVLAGGQNSLTNDRPVKTIGSYWPYLSTVYDYVHRAMPFGEAQSLTADETYAIVAQLLYLNDIVDEDFVLSNENFSEVRLPNEDNFFADDRADADGELATFTVEVCMTDCKETVEITGRAAVVDVTPEDAAARKRIEAAAAEAAGGNVGDAPAEVASAEIGDTPAEETPAETPAEPAAEVDLATADPALIAAGETAFRKCKTCHQVGDGAKNRTGPILNDLFGRVAGEVDGFRYSGAMKTKGEDGLIWTDETLSAYLEDPRAYIKGTKMSFAGFKDAADVAAVIAYLRTFDE